MRLTMLGVVALTLPLLWRVTATGAALPPVGTSSMVTAPAVLSAATGAHKQVTRGDELFYRRCSVCHGKTGLGLEEARLAFPESHQRCTQCHKSGGTKILTFPFVDNNMFDVGEAPPLRGEGTLTAFRDAPTLRAYIQTAMPRHAPGSLTREEAEAITAFVWELKQQ